MSNPIKLSDVVDRLADVHAQINQLTAQADELKAELAAQGPGQITGTFLKAVVNTSAPRKTVDWRGVAEELKPTPDLVSAHTKIGNPVTSVRLLPL